MNAGKNGSAPRTSGSRAMTRPSAYSRRPPRLRAEALGSHPRSRATPRMRARVWSATPGRLLSANETAVVETPAWRATSTIVGPRRRLLRPGRAFRSAPTNWFVPRERGHKTFKSRGRFVVRLAMLAVSLLLLVPGSARAAPLTNTAHLDFLGTTVSPPEQAGHSTYGADPIGVLWTYADRQADGSYRRVGGGAYDAASNTYGQGAFNTDDIARAAVVYVRHWRQTGSAASRERAVALLRGLTYLQSPNGNVVLWMQPDGTLNVSADPPETPDPSDSGASYWLARTVWALGEGYAAFRRDDPAFAAFLRDRLELALG